MRRESTAPTMTTPLLILLSLVIAGLSTPGVALAQARSIVVDSDALEITGDGDGDPASFDGQPFIASVSDGVAVFAFAGDGAFGPDDSVFPEGSNAVSLRWQPVRL